MIFVSRYASLLVAATIVALSIQLSSAELPPGYEDVMWCPEGYCDQAVKLDLVGPKSSFHICYDPSSNSTLDEVWTGELSDSIASDGWIANPDPCLKDGEDDKNDLAVKDKKDSAEKDKNDPTSTGTRTTGIVLASIPLLFVLLF
eukprot:CAMPEP_0194131598 /NCGR_PEP_ID=MMETSP0152-20130528/2344_1 /TAXON_ID=1049557 /ORGANISM="Thalassiothrix antarctica, Strain L6-D1" /LENGTH=144 /DNA_ID=CAMNT_0038826441 /DNA_START=59 /DNA_END=493 /DNA_ORIENTATION=+